MRHSSMKDRQSRIDVRVDGDTVWLSSLEQITELFGRDHYAVLSNLLSAPAVAARAVAPFLASLIVVGAGSYDSLVWVLFGIGLAALLAIWIATGTSDVERSAAKASLSRTRE